MAGGWWVHGSPTTSAWTVCVATGNAWMDGQLRLCGVVELEQSKQGSRQLKRCRWLWLSAVCSAIGLLLPHWHLLVQFGEEVEDDVD